MQAFKKEAAAQRRGLCLFLKKKEAYFLCSRERKGLLPLPFLWKRNPDVAR